MASNPQHEPTMEEILASIRKIISEDSAEAAPAPQPQPEPPKAAAPAPQPVPAPAPEPDVLELTNAIEEPTPAPTPVQLKPADEIVFQSIDEEDAVSSPAEAPAHSSEGIFSEKTRKALDDAFAKLEPAAEEPRTSYSPGAPVANTEGISVEAVFDRAIRETFDPVLGKWLADNADAIVERMKPVISEWLDEHFPAMLEEAVSREVARVVKARRR